MFEDAFITKVTPSESLQTAIHFRWFNYGLIVCILDLCVHLAHIQVYVNTHIRVCHLSVA